MLRHFVFLHPDGRTASLALGWGRRIVWDDPQSSLLVSAEVGLVERAVVIRELCASARTSSEGVSASALRGASVGTLERLLNTRPISTAVTKALGTPARDTPRLPKRISTDSLARALAEVESETIAVSPAVPPGDPGRRDDAFYDNIALTHAVLSIFSSKPAEEIATANRIAPSTVYRWLKEARRRAGVRPSAEQSP